MFQLLWVLGALGAVVLQPGTGQGLAIYTGVSVVALVAYIAGTKTRRGRAANERP